MSEKQLEPLSPDIQTLLEGSRTVPPAPDDLRWRALARARRAVDTGELHGDKVPSWRPRAGLVAAILVGIGGLAWALRTLEPRLPSSHSEHDSPSALSNVADGRGSVGSVALPSESSPAASVVRTDAQPTLVVPAPSASSGSKASSRETELLFLERARHSAQAGNYAATLSAVSEHARRFPLGRLSEEREALRVRALWGLGRTSEARSAVQAFGRDFPRSVLLPSLTRMVGTAP
jgi:hypothetical protein